MRKKSTVAPLAPRPYRAEQIKALRPLAFLTFKNRDTAGSWQQVARKLGIKTRIEKVNERSFRLWRME